MTVMVAGQIARDLVLTVAAVPGPGEAADAGERREMLGGKGANQAVALAQLGVPVALLGVAGADETGERLLAQARADGIDVSSVRVRGRSALIVELLDADGEWRYVQHLPEESLLTPEDVTAVAGLVAALLRGDDPVSAAKHAVAAASSTLGHPGGRPDLTPESLTRRIALINDALDDAGPGAAR